MSSLTGTCHCGAVRVTVPRKPRSLTDCNCSICRRYGVLWAYYTAAQVKVEGAKSTQAYKWGRKALNFVRCKHCGCLVCWQRVKKNPERKMGVNWRNFPLALVEQTRLRKLDGAAWGGESW
jgi:hypothetical protein